jgi:hypothetical protein
VLCEMSVAGITQENMAGRFPPVNCGQLDEV